MSGTGHAQHGTDDILIAPVSGTATAAANLDTVGGDYATIRIAISSEANTDAVGPTLSLLENDTTVVTNFATITADRSAEDITAEKAVTYHVDLRGRKRYLRLSITPGTVATNDAVVIGAVSTLYKEELPSAASGMADAAVVI